MEYVNFGSTGLRVSRLSIGTGTDGYGGRSQQTALGIDGLADLLKAGYDHGVNFWDAADGYGSHPHLVRALQDIPRHEVVIATKTTSRSGKAVQRDVERFLRELGTDVLDIVLLHCLMGPDWERKCARAMDALDRAKERGTVRAVGVSCHSLPALRRAAESPWVDVVLVRINYAGISMDGSPKEVIPVIERMHRAGKAIYGMKVLGHGNLAPQAREAIEYVLSLGTVHAITIGITGHEQLLQNVRLMDELAPQYPPGRATS